MRVCSIGYTAVSKTKDVPQPVTLPADLVSDRSLTSVRPLPGGSISNVFRAESPDGTIFVKTMGDPPADFFDREVAGLNALRATGAIPVPRVLWHTPSALALEWIDRVDAAEVSSGGDAGGQELFGAQLAAVHSQSGEAFGTVDAATGGYLGSVPLDLTPQTVWPRAYLEQRVRPLARQAIAANGLDPAALPMIDHLSGRDESFWGPSEPPSLVHGDLWHGNRVVGSDGRHWLVDPSAHYGHRELDLAFMRLFGGFDRATFSAYMEVWPLAPGWQERTDLYQLAPLLANILIHGGTAGQRVMERLTRLA